jgi:hypothetical protein
LAGAGRLEPELSGAIDLWVGSWSGSAQEGDERRSAAYDQSVPTLASALTAADVGVALGRVEAALGGAERLGRIGLPEAVALRLAAARDEAAAARRAFEAGDLSGTLRATLHAADILRAVGPEGVARTLIARAEGGLAYGGSPADPVGVARAQRLVAGARQAADDAQFGLAIQRAYYACQLLGVAL